MGEGLAEPRTAYPLLYDLTTERRRAQRPLELHFKNKFVSMFLTEQLTGQRLFSCEAQGFGCHQLRGPSSDRLVHNVVKASCTQCPQISRLRCLLMKLKKAYWWLFSLEKFVFKMQFRLTSGL